MHARTPRFLILTTILAMRVIQPMDDAETCRRKIDTTYDSRGLNALHCAAQEKNHMRLQHILEQGANPFAKTRNMLALSPLRLALRVFCDTNTPHTPDAFDGDHARRIEDNADCAFETIAALLNALREHTILHQRLVLAELNEADSTGNTPLHHLLDSACKHREALLPSQRCGIPTLVTKLVAIGAHPAQVNANGHSAFMRALTESRHDRQAENHEAAAMFKMIARVLVRDTATTPPPPLTPALDSPRFARHIPQLDPDIVRQRAHSTSSVRRLRSPISPDSDAMNPPRRQRLLSPIASRK